MLLFLKLFFGFFPSLFKGFYIFGKIIYRFSFLDLWLGFLNPKVIYGNILGLYFSYGNVNRTINLLNLIIDFSNIKNGLKDCFSLSLDCFFNYLFLYI